ncbi:MAG: DUF1877 family protein [Janthinobacterium lividum]
MGQVASLFCLTEQNFQRLNADPVAFDFSQPGLEGEAFNQTQEGLRFVLAKGRDTESTALIEQIFNPWSSVGEEIDYENIDWDQASDDFPFDAQPIYYNPPETVDAIATFLATITDESFRQAFNPEELNQAEVYPSGVWNRKTGLNQGFNEQALVEDLHLLRSFFIRIQQQGNYCVCFVG